MANGGGNTLLIGMLFLALLGVGGYILLKNRKGTQLDISAQLAPAQNYTLGTGGLTYPIGTGGYYPTDINYNYNYFDNDRYNRDRDYRDWWDRYGNRRDEERHWWDRYGGGRRDEERHWWEFWRRDDDDDNRRTDDRSYMYYWNRFGDELRSLGLDDTDIDEFVRWVTKRSRSEREIREWINAKVAEHLDTTNPYHQWGDRDWDWNRYGSIS